MEKKMNEDYPQINEDPDPQQNPFYYNQNQNMFYPPGLQLQFPAQTNRQQLDYENQSPTEEDKPSSALLEHLELTFFKTQACSNQNPHNHKQCQYYHGPKDRRRLGVNYSSDLCEYSENETGANCPMGDKCLKAHNKVEQLYRPDKYKTKFCTLYPNNCHNCEYGPYCSFAHTESDIMIELIHNLELDDDFYIFYYKTVWCPFNYIQHDRGQCVYAHNWQDYRRKPHVYYYEPVPCQTWKPNDFITKYEDGCPNKYDCNKCHGWKEFEYHPKNYRMRSCSSGNVCQKGRACPYFHNPQEKRTLPPSVQSKLFRLTPRNRIIKGTFKQLIPQIQKQRQIKITNLSSTQSLPAQLQIKSIPNKTVRINKVNTFNDFTQGSKNAEVFQSEGLHMIDGNNFFEYQRDFDNIHQLEGQMGHLNIGQNQKLGPGHRQNRINTFTCFNNYSNNDKQNNIIQQQQQQQFYQDEITIMQESDLKQDFEMAPPPSSYQLLMAGNNQPQKKISKFGTIQEVSPVTVSVGHQSEDYMIEAQQQLQQQCGINNSSNSKDKKKKALNYNVNVFVMNQEQQQQQQQQQQLQLHAQQQYLSQHQQQQQLSIQQQQQQQQQLFQQQKEDILVNSVINNILNDDYSPKQQDLNKEFNKLQ